MKLSNNAINNAIKDFVLGTTNPTQPIQVGLLINLGGEDGRNNGIAAGKYKVIKAFKIGFNGDEFVFVKAIRIGGPDKRLPIHQASSYP